MHGYHAICARSMYNSEYGKGACMDITLFVPVVCITASMGKVHAWISHVLCQGFVVVHQLCQQQGFKLDLNVSMSQQPHKQCVQSTFVCSLVLSRLKY